MENLLLSARVMLPIFLMLTLGYLLRRVSLVDDHTLSGCNSLVFRVFLPAMLFQNVYNTDVATAFNPRLLAFAVGGTLALFALSMIIIPRLETDRPKQASMVQAVFRSNFVIFGLPVTAALFGQEKVGVAAILVAAVVPLFNVLAVFALEYFRGGKVDLKKALRGVVTNPLIIGAGLGLFCLLTGLRLPAPVESTISDVGHVGTPLALIVLGGTFRFSALRSSARQLVICVVGRLLVGPAIFLSAAALLGFREVEIAALISLFASPTASSSYPMACEMGADGELAGQAVVCNSFFAIFTVFFWIFLFKQLGIM